MTYLLTYCKGSNEKVSVNNSEYGYNFLCVYSCSAKIEVCPHTQGATIITIYNCKTRKQSTTDRVEIGLWYRLQWHWPKKLNV